MQDERENDNNEHSSPVKLITIQLGLVSGSESDVIEDRQEREKRAFH